MAIDRWEFRAPRFHDFRAGDDDANADEWFESNENTKGLITPLAVRDKPTRNAVSGSPGSRMFETGAASS